VGDVAFDQTDVSRLSCTDTQVLMPQRIKSFQMGRFWQSSTGTADRGPVGRPDPAQHGTNNAPVRSVLKKPISRRSDRRKNDEDIAERITGGVRVERPAVRREEQNSTPQNHAAAADRVGPRGRRRTP
jgi:hypothetical protein